jgi:hypothetical protein
VAADEGGDTQPPPTTLAVGATWKTPRTGEGGTEVAAVAVAAAAAVAVGITANTTTRVTTVAGAGEPPRHAAA